MGRGESDASRWKEPDTAREFLQRRSAHVPFRQTQQAVIARVCGLLSSPPTRILDLGCGDGIVLEHLLDRFPAATGIGVDCSLPMLESAAQRLAPLVSRCELSEADLADPDWLDDLEEDDQSFDVVVASFAIHHLTDERKFDVYREAFDLLRPGGVFINCEHVASPTPEIEGLFESAYIELLWEGRTAAGETITREQIAKEYAARGDAEENRLTLLESQLRWLREIGFREVDCFWKWFELAVFGGRRPVAQ